MNGFLAELGRKFADRWFALLVLPGLFYAGVAAVALTLRQRNWADWQAVWDGVNELTTQTEGQNVGARTALVLVALLPLSTALGLLAQGLAGPVERAMSGEWPRPLAGLATRLTERRAERWRAAHTAYEDAERDPAGHDEAVAEAAARRNAIALMSPRRPTWMGDRLLAPGVRIDAEYGLDLPSLWSRLWLILPEETRGTLAESRRRLDEAMTLGGWAVLYLALGVVWWPAALIGLGAGLASHRRGRVAAEVYADLVEATVDVNLDRLGRRLGGEWPRRRGRGITARTRKGA
ncbi:hypothetical protein [Streptomyces sp. 6N223]|uniref:hypothetical protein n=1 Tax=Streptomyces sp. 6N223 TaxID=3457412 RepID=UPI003FD2683A